MLLQHFENPPALGQKKGGNSIEVGLMEIFQRLESERMFVFSTLDDFWQEYRMYHRKEQKVVPLHDDCMSAWRYAVQSLRFADVESNETWSQEIKYQNLGIV